MDDRTLALLGDRAAQERITERGELLPCPFCGFDKIKIDSKKGNNFRFVNGKKEEYHVVTVRCNKCHTRGPTVSIYMRVGQYNAAEIMEMKAIKFWNTRALYPDAGAD